MTRKCSHCSHNGHNSRTCPVRGVKIFGVRLTEGSIRKSSSMGNLSHYSGENPEPDATATDGYATDDFARGSYSSGCPERKKGQASCESDEVMNIEVLKGVPWTEDEHRLFLLGLQKLGKGDWRGISRNFVTSRTPTQVASHAQKYFNRQTNPSRRKRRSSLFDMVADESVDTPVVAQDLLHISHQQPETQSSDPSPAAPVLDEECKSMDFTNSNNGEAVAPKPEVSQCSYPVIFPGYFSPFYPFSFPCWPSFTVEAAEKDAHEVVKPTAVHSRKPINVDELVGMSKLSLGESLGHVAPSSLSLELLEGPARQSAFRANPATSCSNMNSSSSLIHAV